MNYSHIYKQQLFCRKIVATRHKFGENKKKSERGCLLIMCGAFDCSLLPVLNAKHRFVYNFFVVAAALNINYVYYLFFMCYAARMKQKTKKRELCGL